MSQSIDSLPFDKLTVEHLIAYLDHHNGQKPDNIKAPVRSNKMSEICSDPFDVHFINVLFRHQRTLFYNLMNAADQLQIPSLVDLCCAKLATQIKGQPRCKLRSILLK